MDFNHIQSLNADRLTGLSKSNTYDYSDVLIWTKGRHTMKFGLNIQTLEAITPLGFNGSDNYGTYYFNTSGSAGLFTGVDFADFLLGIPNASFYDVVRQDNDGISAHYHFFGQDEWRLNPKLTLSYGLRYELSPWLLRSLRRYRQFRSHRGAVGASHLPPGQAVAAGAKLPGQRQRLRSGRREQYQLAT